MSPYIDAIVIPVPRANLDTYKRMSAEWGNAHLRHGALYYSDSISDDVQPGKVTSFPQAVQLKDDEVIALAWVVYRRGVQHGPALGMASNKYVSSQLESRVMSPRDRCTPGTHHSRLLLVTDTPVTGHTATAMP